MKDPVKEQERNFKLLLTIIGLFLVLASLGVAINDYILETRSVKVSAKVLEVKVINGKNKAKVSFRLTGREYETDVTIRNNSKVAVDDKIIVKVNMYNPKREIINNHYYIYGPGFIVGAILLILSLPYLIKNYKLSIYRKKLKEKGIFVNANITEIYLNNNPKLNKHGSYPYRLRAKYFNPQNQTEYVFESDDTYVNLNDPVTEYQKTTVVVYLNLEDLTKYYVDLDSLYPALDVVDPIAIMGPKTEIKFRFGTKAEQAYQEEQKAKEEQQGNQEQPPESQEQ